MEIDVNYIRNADSEMHGIPLCDEKLTFYYDETNNCGKFYLTEVGINDESALLCDFILGGVMYDGEENPADIDKLFQNLKLQSSIKEVKFKHINRGRKPFLEFMDSDRVTTFVEWLYESGLYIHYATLNNLYYGLVDLVDSIWETRPQFAFSFEWVQYLKSELYNFCLVHLEGTLHLMHKYHFPDIDKEKTRDFCLDFCNFIQTYNDDTTQAGFGMETLRQMLKDVGKHGEISLLYDNEPNILVNEYYTLYMGRCYTYKNAFHYFDREKVIESKLNEVKLLEEGMQLKNYDFIESTDNPLIQVSDVFVGLLSKVFRYLDGVTEDDIMAIDQTKNAQAILNLRKLNELIIRSDRKHPMLIQNVNDVQLTKHRMVKLELLIGGDS